VRIRREDLYKAVWTAPLRKLARDWDISDVGLAKACRNSGIPLPGLGHWAKVAVGRGASPPPLKGNPDSEVEFHGAPSLRKVGLHPEGKTSLEKALNIAEQAIAESKEDPPRLGRWTKRTVATLRKKPDAWGFLSAGEKAFRVSISEGTRDQVITILNVVEQALASVGMSWETDEKSGAVVGKLYGESVSFSIAERYTRTEHIEHDPKYSWADKKTYTYQFTGDLTLRIDGWYDGRKSWSDGKTQRLIEKLPEVVEGFIAAADALRRKKIELEEQRQRWAEEARRRAEQDRIEREEQEFLKATIKEANDWAQANVIRSYVAHLRKRISDEKIQLTAEGEKWLSRMDTAADRLDSVKLRLDE
jgi:hypothetical protein